MSALYYLLILLEPGVAGNHKSNPGLLYLDFQSGKSSEASIHLEDGRFETCLCLGKINRRLFFGISFCVLCK